MNWTRQLLRSHDIGAWTYGVPLVHDKWPNSGKLHIGKFCSIADGVEIFLGGNHRTDWITTYPFPPIWREAHWIKGHPATKGDVWIGNDVWLGTRCAIMSGVTIGDGAVVGAHAVVSRDVPAYGIVAGNPAEVKRFRFDPDTIERLLEVKWWDWPEKKIKLGLERLLSGDVKAFLEYAEQTTGDLEGDLDGESGK